MRQICVCQVQGRFEGLATNHAVLRPVVTVIKCKSLIPGWIFLWLCSLQSTDDRKHFILSSHTSVVL